jgi:polyisoprenoid-binding protein YceI
MSPDHSPAPPEQARRSHNARNLLIAVLAVVVLGAVGVGGYGLWYLFLSPAGPAAVTAADPVIPANAVVAAPASLDGTWNVNTSLGSMSDFSASWAGYRVQEQLVGVGAHTAVGRTSTITGSMTLNGAVIDNVQITADLTALQSDDPNRDKQLKRQAINTDQFPTAMFKTIQPINLGTLPAEGQTVSATAKGAFTLHGVTKTVDIDLKAMRKGGVIAVAGTLPVVFADYSFDGPNSFSVLTVDNHGTMELHLLFTHA